MGNICLTNAYKEHIRVSNLTDDELVSEIQKDINKLVAMNLDEIYIANVATEVYFRRFSVNNTAHIILDKIKAIVDTYNKPYTISLGIPYAFIIRFVNFPK